MSSGKKTLVFNTQERAISPDVNRAQAFSAKDDAELWRYMLDVTANDDLDAGSVVAEHLTLENPLRAEIINGLLVRPQPASLNLLVDPGVAYVVAPDTDADASVYKYVRDAGVLALGALTITPGAGSTRIDVIECQLNAVPLTASDNRDIFDPITGLFSATSVTKETQARLTYRVRAGTPGAGFPGTVLGWLPLCVVSVPAAAANVDVMTFWDVRPLISDREYQPFALSTTRPIHIASMVNASSLVAGGLVDIAINGRRLGGRLRSGSVVADADSIDFGNAANQEPGIVFTANRPWLVYLLTPFGLPRWARYNAAGSRVPRSPRGIPVVSMTSPDADGFPTAAISLPTATGLLGSTSAGVAALAGYTTAGGAQGGFFGDDADGYILATGLGSGEPLEAPGVVSGIGTANLTGSWTLTSGVGFPRNARMILVEPRFTYTSIGETLDATIFGQVFAPNGGGQIMQRALYTARDIMGAAATFRARQAFWIPVPTLYPSAASFTLEIRFLLANALTLSGAVGDLNLRTLGWKF